MDSKYSKVDIVNRIAAFMQWQHILGKVELGRRESVIEDNLVVWLSYDWEDEFIHIHYSTCEGHTDDVRVSLIRRGWFSNKYEVVLNDNFHGTSPKVFHPGRWIEHLVEITEGAMESLRAYEKAKKEQKAEKAAAMKKLKQQQSSSPVDDSDVFRKKR